MGHDQAIALTALLPFVLPLLGLMLILFMFVSGSARERVRACARLARELGLTFHRIGWLGSGRMLGERAGQKVHVETWTEASSPNGKTLTYARPAISTQALGLPGFQIVRRSEWDRDNNIRRQNDIETGDEEFDRRFSVRGDDPTLVLKVLTAQVRDLLKAFDARYGLLILDDLWLRSDTVRALDPKQSLRHVLNAEEELLGALSRALSVAMVGEERATLAWRPDAAGERAASPETSAAPVEVEEPAWVS